MTNKGIIRLICIFTTVCFIPILAFGAPQITGRTGSVLHNQTISITGTGFGNKTTAAPYRWDNFSSGTVGQLVTGWSGGMGDNRATYANSPGGRANTQTSLHAFGPTPRYENISLCANDSNGYPVLYIDYWYYINRLGGVSRNFKQWRLYGASDSLQLNPVIECNQSQMLAGDMTWSPAVGPIGAHSWEYDGYPYNLYISDPPTNQVWVHEQAAISVNTVGNNNGTLVRYINSQPSSDDIGTVVFRAQNAQYSEIRIGHYWATDAVEGCASNPGADEYISDLYIDRTLARVEIGNATIYANCTHREIQIPQSWSTSSITARLNQGSFTNTESLYLFVIDSNNAPSPGYGPFTFSSSTISPRIPNSPLLQPIQ